MLVCTNKRLDDLLSNIHVDDEMFHRRDINCTHHKDMKNELYSSVIFLYVSTSIHISTTGRGTKKIEPGWNDSCCVSYTMLVTFYLIVCPLVM